jgi:hypothetical protein
VNNIIILTSAIGEFTKEEQWIEQSIPTDYYVFNNSNFPLRSKAITPRMQARIAKIFCWQLKLGYEFYIWHDNSFRITTDRASEWFMNELGDADGAFLRHPDRTTVKAEWEYIKQAIAENSYYLTPRYNYEWGDEAIAEMYSDKEYVDNLLIAAGAFIIRNNERTQALAKEWWYYTSRYHIADQIGLPYAIYKSGCNVNIIDKSYLRLEHFKYTRRAYYKHFRKMSDGTRRVMSDEERVWHIEKQIRERLMEENYATS